MLETVEGWTHFLERGGPWAITVILGAVLIYLWRLYLAARDKYDKRAESEIKQLVAIVKEDTENDTKLAMLLASIDRRLEHVEKDPK